MEIALEELIAQREEVERHLAALNENWIRYNDILANRIRFESPKERGKAARLALETYYYEDLWLAQHGHPWHTLNYDQVTRMHSLPE